MISRPRLWFFVSLTTMSVSLALILIVRPLWGIDFTGGSLIEVLLPPEQTEIAAKQQTEQLLSEQFHLPATVQTTTQRTLLIRTEILDDAKHRDILAALRDHKLGTDEVRFESIGPTIGNELKRTSLLAVALSLSAIALYLTYTFRKTTRSIASWKFGVAALYALLHDILFVFGFFVVLGKIYGISVDTMFVSAMLAISGYSVNDTIVIFSRLREELKTNFDRKPLAEVLDKSVLATFVRSLNTSLATLLVLGALIIFGGSTIRWFIVALLAGIGVGTYSSIYVAAPCLYMLSQWRRA